MFDDLVEISNSGGLVIAILRNKFGKRSSSRNPLIFGLFERMRMVEQIGYGISRMRDLIKKKDCRPQNLVLMECLELASEDLSISKSR